MSRLGTALSIAAIVGGLIIGLTVGSLIGPLLILGGMGALGVMALPGAIDFFARWLSTGTMRRRR